MGNRNKGRIYWRDRGGAKRAYADFRDYADVGGGREALVALGEKVATADPTTAQVLLARRIEHLDGLRRGKTIQGIAGQTTLGPSLASISWPRLSPKSSPTIGWT